MLAFRNRSRELIVGVELEQGLLGSAPMIETLAASRADDPVLRRFRQALDDAYGMRIERVVLYGSRARGDAVAESDYDVAVFIHDMGDRYDQLDRLADMGTAILEQDNKLIHAIPFRAGSLSAQTPLMHEIRNDGLDL